MHTVEDFIYTHFGQKKEILLFFHHLLTEKFNLTPKIRYKIPFYYQHSWICYLNPTNKGIEFSFPRGNELSNAQGLLQSKGRKQVMGIEFEHVSEIPELAIEEILQEAVLLDETIPYASKRKKS